MNKLSIGEVLKVSIDTYKEKWRTLLLISGISTLISTFVTLFRISMTSLHLTRLQSVFTWAIISLVLALISLYFTSRLSVSMIIVSNKAINDEEIALSESYEKAKYLTWRYIGKSIMFALMLIIPVAMVIIGTFFGHTLGMELSFRTILIIVGSLLTLYLNTTFYFSIYAAVFVPKEESVFSYSKQLVKGNFFKVLIITLIPHILTSPMYAANYFLNTDSLSIGLQFLYTIASNIPSIVISPFSVLLSIVALDRLANANKNPLNEDYEEVLVPTNV